MKRTPILLALTAAFGIAASAALIPAAHAEVPAAEAAKLGTTLTPVGAEKAGNAAGTIPAWDGGVTKAPAGYKEGEHYIDPFAQDKPLFSITAANLSQHQDKLSPGQIEMLKKYPTWKMNVYQTRRSASFPKAIYDATIANATKAKLVEGGSGFTGTTGGIAFPIPKNGVEAIWNHITRYQGDSYATSWSQAAVTREGDYTPVRFEYEYDFHYGNLTKPEKEKEPNKLFNFLQSVTAPARLAGQILLVHEYADQITDPRKAWNYNPGQRRVRLAPQVAYDNPGTAADGLRTNDDFNMFNGSTDRYNWKLAGKKEIYIPYNSYGIVSNKIKMADVVKPGHINPEQARYELHRVWVVDATLKEGSSHVYKRRTFYLDEDSWNIVLVDKYDNRDQLWRTAEMHTLNAYSVPMQYAVLQSHNDLQSGRYIVMGLRNEEPKFSEKIKRNAADYSPAGLSRLGVR